MQASPHLVPMVLGKGRGGGGDNWCILTCSMLKQFAEWRHDVKNSIKQPQDFILTDCIP